MASVSREASPPASGIVSRPSIRITTTIDTARELPISRPYTSEVQSPTPTASARIWLGPGPLPLSRRPLTPHPEIVRSGLYSNPSTPLVSQDGFWGFGKRYMNATLATIPRDITSSTLERLTPEFHYTPQQSTLHDARFGDCTDSVATPISVESDHIGDVELGEVTLVESDNSFPGENTLKISTLSLHRIDEYATTPTPVSAIRVFSPFSAFSGFPLPRSGSSWGFS